jgi:microcystin-dependent protein
MRIFAGNFAPRNFAFCNGQIIAIAQNTAFFALIGTTYGGNGQTTFAIPDLRGRVPIHAGQGVGLSNYVLGQAGGEPSHTLVTTEIPAHTHTPACFSTSPNPAPLLSPQGNVWAVASSRRVPANLYRSAAGTGAAMNAQALANTGGGQAHENRQPYLGLNFIICQFGIFPARN